MGNETEACNPSWEDCRCEWGRAEWERGLKVEEGWSPEPDFFLWGERYGDMDSGERLHSLILQLDGPNFAEAMVDLLAHMHDGFIPHGDAGFAKVFAQHNWSDPVAFHSLGIALDETLGSFRKEAEQLVRARGADARNRAA